MDTIGERISRERRWLNLRICFQYKRDFLIFLIQPVIIYFSEICFSIEV